MREYEWKISDGYPKWNGLKVFSCFACGGGSTMGYKRSGYKVIGCNEIDKDIAKVYKLNHNPKFIFNEPIQVFSKRELSNYPEELFNLDILDGSPPCSLFSVNGIREDGWGKEKYFREGQESQILDTLFFDFILLAKKLQPKVVVSENVKGLFMGNAKDYFKRIMKEFDEAGYISNHYVLNGNKMGLCQKRERVFIISVRKDVCLKYFQDNFPYIDMNFHEDIVTFEEATRPYWMKPRKKLTPTGEKYWYEAKEGSCFAEQTGGSLFNWLKLSRFEEAPTLTTHWNTFFHPIIPGSLNEQEYSICGSYPLDYQTIDKVELQYLIGMSVPPLMIQKISKRIEEFIFNKIKK